MQREAFEPTGLVPRSIIRTFDRFLQQLLPGTESIALHEFRVSRYQILVSVKALLILVCIPFIVNYTVKSFFLTPLTEYFWNCEQNEIFLNAYQEKRAFAEMQDFSEKIFFESLIEELPPLTPTQSISTDISIGSRHFFDTNETGPTSPSLNPNFSNKSIPSPLGQHFVPLAPPSPHHLRWKASPEANTNHLWWTGGLVDTSEILYSSTNRLTSVNQFSIHQIADTVVSEEIYLQQLFQQKSLEIANLYNKQSILAITNLLGDFLTFSTLWLLFVFMKPQIIILKSFLTESIYSLSDTTKSFLLILVMDLLVGFHSPRGWEIVLEVVLRHLGLPENENFILLFVALFPVFLDTVFKYWIFRYLNKISPSTVVTYHSMLE
uniref:Potassium/proton antiporter CemA n=1 Tax=Watanabea reniformis TaxID=191674 RepID=A0A097KK44_9CHLO|nr:chloroplast enveloppe membrane protein [Watanabea reniformis]AIT93555.1 chloroplast enveloppe membrane protein [Watanabea reniformis]